MGAHGIPVLRHSGLRLRALGFLTGAAAVAAILAVSSGGTAPSPLRPVSKPLPLPAVVAPAGLAERAGVRVVRVSAIGAGGLVDLRYQVVDSEKANAVHDPTTPPLIVHERTGAVVARPLMGHIHSGRPKVGLTYYLIFENSGTIIRRGDRVTVRLGDARLAHVTVQ